MTSVIEHVDAVLAGDCLMMTPASGSYLYNPNVLPNHTVPEGSTVIAKNVALAMVTEDGSTGAFTSLSVLLST